MAVGKIASWAYAEQFLDEDELFEVPLVVQAARERASVRALTPQLRASAAQIRTIAALNQADSIIQIGVGAGVLSLYLLSARPQATYTLIDEEPENLQLCTKAFLATGIKNLRLRTINGDELQILAKLNTEHYDLLVVNADHPKLLEIFEQAKRLIKAGKAIVINNILHHDQLSSELTSKELVQIKTLLTSVKSDPRLITSISPAGDGVLTVVKR